MKAVDARGLSCPEPVLRSRDTLRGLARGEELEILVDTVTSRENVSRMARSQGYEVTVERAGDDFRLLIRKQ